MCEWTMNILDVEKELEVEENAGRDSGWDELSQKDPIYFSNKTYKKSVSSIEYFTRRHPLAIAKHISECRKLKVN